MAKIAKNFGSGGANLTPGGASNPNSLAVVLRDIADDLGLLNGGVAGAITAADATAAAGANPTKAEFDVVVTLVNQIKAKLNTPSNGGRVLKTTKG